MVEWEGSGDGAREQVLENGFMKIRATHSRITKIYGRSANYGRDRICIAPKISPRTIYRSRWHLQAKTQTVYRRGNVCSPRQARSYVFFSFIRACKRKAAYPARRISPGEKGDSRSTSPRGRRGIDAIWKRSIFVRVASSEYAARSLTGARDDWIELILRKQRAFM